MVRFRLDGAGELADDLKAAADAGLPRTTRALRAAAEEVVAEKWRHWAGGGTLPGVAYKIKRPRGFYRDSIETRQVSPLEFEVYSAIRQAAYLEWGTKEADFKRTHPFGKRGRVGKDGVPYLIVPFRWGTDRKSAPALRNIMPKSVYNIVKAFEKSVVTADKSNTRVFAENARGEKVPRQTYRWGGRLMDDLLGTTDSGKAVSLKGLSRPDDQPTGNSTYMAFRVVKANSPKGSWIKPPFPALHATEKIAALSEKEVAQIVEAAARADFLA